MKYNQLDGLSNVLANTSPVILFASRKNAERRNDGSSHKTRTFRGRDQTLGSWSCQKERFPTHGKAACVQGMAKSWIFPPTFDHGVYDARRRLCLPTIGRSMWILNHSGRLDILALFTLTGTQCVCDAKNFAGHLAGSCRLSRQSIR